jgi:hypothetical protein
MYFFIIKLKMFDLRKRIMANQVAPAPEGSLSLP